MRDKPTIRQTSIIAGSMAGCRSATTPPKAVIVAVCALGKEGSYCISLLKMLTSGRLICGRTLLNRNLMLCAEAWAKNTAPRILVPGTEGTKSIKNKQIPTTEEKPAKCVKAGMIKSRERHFIVLLQKLNNATSNRAKILSKISPRAGTVLLVVDINCAISNVDSV